MTAPDVHETYREETTMTDITIPAYAADTLGETMTVAAPDAWHDRIEALSVRVSYGPDYSRSAKDHLLDMSRLVRDGYTALAYDHLIAAELSR